MNLQDIIQAAQELSLQEQMKLVSQLVQALEQTIQTGVTTTPLQIPTNQPTSNTTVVTGSLKGKVEYYDAPYESVALEDWEAFINLTTPNLTTGADPPAVPMRSWPY